jgi:hypothetical protein
VRDTLFPPFCRWRDENVANPDNPAGMPGPYFYIALETLAFFSMARRLLYFL